MPSLDPRALPLEPAAADRCLPAVHVDPQGHAVPDPYEVLGLDTRPAPPETIRAAAREALLAHPPETAPREAERTLQARERLTAEDQFEARHLGVLHVPDPEAWGLPRPGQAEGSGGSALTPLARLLGQAVLYTLVEEALWTEGLGALYDEAIAELQAAPQEPR